MRNESRFGSKEEAWKYLDRLKQKVYASYRAYRSTEDELRSLENFDTRTVLDVAGRYAAYDLQLRILDDDQQRLMEELEGHDISEALEIFRQWRMELEAAVRNAQLGNYALLKHWFAVCQSRQEYEVIDLNLKSKLEKVIQVLPDQTELLQLPLPAWQDPRFNEEKSQNDI